MSADSDADHAELADMVAAINVTPSQPHNGFRSNPGRNPPRRLSLSDRKLSLQERGTSRVARQPTIESKRVSISDSEVNV